MWTASGGAIPFSATPTCEIGLPEGFERQTYEAEFGEEGAFAGYGSSAFSPDEATLASVVEIRGDWADDSIVFLEAGTLRKKNIFHGQGHITDIAWTTDSRQIIYCAAARRTGWKWRRWYRNLCHSARNFARAIRICRCACVSARG